MNDSSPQSTANVEMPEQAEEPTGREHLLKEIGLKLSHARQLSGESIEEAVRKLKLRKKHLLALEDGNWDNMPDEVYVLGFLRQYSQYLHVDLSDEIHRLKNAQYALTKPLTFPDPPVAPSRRWVWISGIAFVLLFILFNITAENKITNADKISLSLPVRNSADIISIPSASMPVAALPASEQADKEKQAVANTAEQTIAAQLPATTQMPAADNPVTHTFRFSAVDEPVWLQISMPNQSGTDKGRLLKEILLQPGFHTSIRAQTESLWITCGNAPALRISLDGRILIGRGSLGGGKKVLRDYRFSIHE